MPVLNLPRADKEIAAAIFKEHFEVLWRNGRPQKLGWERREIDPLHTLVTLPATRSTGEIDRYHFLLGAEYYDAWPPTVWLVSPDNLQHASHPSMWYPVFSQVPGWFNLHTTYPWPAPTPPKQLVCFSMNAEFYLTDHSPQESEKWRQGRHTLAMTLFRLAEVLGQPYYKGPSA